MGHGRGEAESAVARWTTSIGIEDKVVRWGEGDDAGKRFCGDGPGEAARATGPRRGRVAMISFGTRPIADGPDGPRGP